MRTIHPAILCLAVCLPLLLLSGCAPPVMPGAAQSGPGNLTTDVRRLSGTVAEQAHSIEELTRDLSELRARIDQQQQEIATLNRQVAMTAESRPALEGAPKTSSALVPTDSHTIPTELEGSPTDIYLRAFGNYANGRYDAAILGFEVFLQSFPNNSYASNAQFWLADSYLKQQQLTPAAEAFNTMLRLYPQAPKAPEALLKIATIQLQMDTPELARETLDRLRRQYPDSAAAKKAEQLVLP